MSARFSGSVLVCLSLVLACGGDEKKASPPAAPAGAPAQAPAAEAAPEAAQLPDADAYPRGIMLALAQFVKKDGKPVPGAARIEFIYRANGEWRSAAVEDPESNVFHKSMHYEGGAEPVILSMGGTAAKVKAWSQGAAGLEPHEIWGADFGGKWSRMRDAEVADLYGDGKASIAVATHDQGVVVVLRPGDDGSFEVVELDRRPDTFVHEIEIGDLDGDGVPEVYATPSEPNRLDGSPQSGEVVRYVPAKGEGRAVVADLGDRHAKEILVADVDGDGRDELYVSVEGHTGGADGKQLLEPVEIRRYEADTPPGEGVVIGTIDDRLTRFLTAGDIDGDGKKELVAAAFKKGVWLFRPGAEPRGPWQAELIDADSGGFEHASILTDLDGDGRDELYVASDDDKELRRYRWDGKKLVRDTIYKRPDARPIFTWNLMPVPVEMIPSGSAAPAGS